MKLFDWPNKTQPGRVHVAANSADFKQMVDAMRSTEVCSGWLAVAGFAGDFIVTDMRIAPSENGKRLEDQVEFTIRFIGEYPPGDRPPGEEPWDGTYLRLPDGREIRAR